MLPIVGTVLGVFACNALLGYLGIWLRHEYLCDGPILWWQDIKKLRGTKLWIIATIFGSLFLLLVMEELDYQNKEHERKTKAPTRCYPACCR